MPNALLLKVAGVVFVNNGADSGGGGGGNGCEHCSNGGDMI